MISLAELKIIANTRLEDSFILAVYDRYDTAVYLCGYALEIALKINARHRRGGLDFPETSSEFRATGATDLKTHNLTRLLKLSGCEPVIKSKVFTTNILILLQTTGGLSIVTGNWLGASTDLLPLR